MSLLNNNFTRFLLKVCQHKHLHEKCLKSKFSKYKALYFERKWMLYTNISQAVYITKVLFMLGTLHEQPVHHNDDFN